MLCLTAAALAAVGHAPDRQYNPSLLAASSRHQQSSPRGDGLKALDGRIHSCVTTAAVRAPESQVKRNPWSNIIALVLCFRSFGSESLVAALFMTKAHSFTVCSFCHGYKLEPLSKPLAKAECYQCYCHNREVAVSIPQFSFCFNPDKYHMNMIKLQR